MKLVKNDTPYEEIRSRMETEDGIFYFGIHNVMFGRRIRAGEYGNGWVDLDWCCGDDQVLLYKTYIAIQSHLERWDGKGNPFSNLPACSNIKPLYHDKKFLDKVRSIIPEFNEIKYVER